MKGSIIRNTDFAVYNVSIPAQAGTPAVKINGIADLDWTVPGTHPLNDRSILVASLAEDPESSLPIQRTDDNGLYVQAKPNGPMVVFDPETLDTGVSYSIGETRVVEAITHYDGTEVVRKRESGLDPDAWKHSV